MKEHQSILLRNILPKTPGFYWNRLTKSVMIFLAKSKTEKFKLKVHLCESERNLPP